MQTGVMIGFWLPILAKAVMKTIECTDYNIVQNNGMHHIPLES